MSRFRRLSAAAAVAVLVGVLGFGTVSARPGAQSAASPAPSPRDAAPKPSLPAALTVDTIMKGDDFVGRSPSNPQWSADGRTLYFRWRKPGTDAEQTFAVPASGPGEPVPVKPEDFLRHPPAGAGSGAAGFRRYGFGFGFGGSDIRLDRAGRRALVVQNGDIFLVGLPKGEAVRLTATDERERNAAFTRDEKRIVFQSGDNLFILDPATGRVTQMTSFTRSVPPPDKASTPLETWYADQQKSLFKDLAGNEPRFRGGRGRDPLPELAPGPRRKPFPLQPGQQVFAQLSPDEKTAVFSLYEETPSKETLVPAYVTRSGYTETIPSHPKAAEAGGRAPRWGAVSVETGEVKWLDAGFGDRAVYAGEVLWSPDGRAAVMTARSADRKDAWILRLDVPAAKGTPIVSIHDDAWIGELSLSDVFWWPDGSAVAFISEKDGFAQLYKATLDGKTVTPLTSGRFEVREAFLSRDGKTVYLASNEEHPGEYHFYAMPSAGGPRTRLTALPGWNEATLSPDEKTLAVLNSRSNRPPELFLQANRPGAAARQVTVSTTEAFRSLSWIDPEVISFKARDGADVYARIFTPAKPHPARPAVIFIHGAGYLQNATRGWSSYFREYMFHNLLAEHGYVVMDVDYRGSAGYGRGVRTAIYRHMGGKDLDDVIDAAKYLARERGVDPARIGCYGGSYGGFLTLMALFTAPDVFRAGAALRPVTDWAHYHAGYTADILNLPQDDPEAFKRSSPIYFAEGLKGALLICHGMVDTNVHFQDSVRLAERLIELGKTNWELAPYPLEDHSFTRATSWTDEYKRILKLFEENLKS